MSRLLKNGVAAHWVIDVFDDSDAPVTGLVNGDFTKYVTLNGAPDALSLTVTEINAGTRPGQYDVSFTPPSSGYWHFRVLHATYAPRGFVEDFTVTGDGVLLLSDINGISNLTTTTSNVSTLLGRLTALRAGYLDLLNSYLDVAVSSRMPDGGAIGVNNIDAPTLAAIADAIAGIDIDGATLQAALRYIAATACGESSGDPGTPTFKGLDGTTDRLSAVVDSDGNRTSVVLDP